MLRISSGLLTRWAASVMSQPAGAASVHNVAAAGFAEGTNDLYDRARPSYPASALQHIHSSLDPKQGAVVLEPGSGTGIFSRLLLSTPTPDYPVFDLKALIAIEPSAGMRAAWKKGMDKVPQKVLEKVEARTVDGGFDEFSHAGVPNGSADAVMIAQAWHWCPNYDKALREIASYLKPGAPLVLVWNLESNEEPWAAELREVFQAMDRGSPQYYRGLWRAMFDCSAYTELFQPAEEQHFKWDLGMTEDQLVDRLFSKSYLTEAFLSGDERAQFEQRLRKTIRDGEKEWVDEDRGVFRYKYSTDVYIIRRAE